MHGPSDFDFSSGCELRIVQSSNLNKCVVHTEHDSHHEHTIEALDPDVLQSSRACWLLIDSPYRATRYYLIRDEWIYLYMLLTSSQGEDHCYTGPHGSGKTGFFWYILFKLVREMRVSIVKADNRIYRLSWMELLPGDGEEERIALRGRLDDLTNDLPDIVIFGSRVRKINLPIRKLYCTPWAQMERELVQAGRTFDSIPPLTPLEYQGDLKQPNNKVRLESTTLNIWRTSPINYLEAALLVAANDMSQTMRKQTNNSLLSKLNKQLLTLTNNKVGLPHVAYVTHVAIQRYQERKKQILTCDTGEAVSGSISRDVLYALGSVVGPFYSSSLTDIQRSVLRDPLLEPLGNRIIKALKGYKDLPTKSDPNEGPVDCSFDNSPLILRQGPRAEIPNKVELWTTLQRNVIGGGMADLLCTRGVRRFTTVFKICLAAFLSGARMDSFLPPTDSLKDSIKYELHKIQENMSELDHRVMSPQEFMSYLSSPNSACIRQIYRKSDDGYVIDYANRLWAAYIDTKRLELQVPLRCTRLTYARVEYEADDQIIHLSVSEPDNDASYDFVTKRPDVV